MRSEITEKTMIPLTWAVAGLIFLFGPAVAASVWVKGVNDWMKAVDSRLARIEKKVGIPEYQTEAQSSLIPSAQAEERKR